MRIIPGPQNGTIEDSATEDSFALHCFDSLTVAQHAFADEYHGLLRFHSADNFDVCSVAKTGFYRCLPGLVVHDCKNKRAGSFYDQGFSRHKYRVLFPLDANSHGGIHAGPNLEFGIRKLDFGQHGFGSLIQRVGEARDFTVENSPGRSEERRVGKECRYRMWPEHE